MARTPDVVANETIATAWGNEIRDRTVQVFASVAEMNTWTSAPTGSLAFVTVDADMYRRSGSTWRIFAGSTWAGPANATTFSNGQVNLPHSLGVVPTWAIVQPRTPSAWAFHYIQGMSASGITVLTHDVLHQPLNVVAISSYIQVGL